jgi:hypothetical protein
MADLVASPSLCLLARRHPASALSAYELTARERDRLAAIVWQRGMSTNCSLYRANRITPLYTHLGLTCTLLGERLMSEVELFWQFCRESDLQFESEIKRFAAFLRARVQDGKLDCPPLEAVVDFELAVNELLYLPRRRLAEELLDAPAVRDVGSIQSHPLVRLVRFAHEPSRLLTALAALQAPPDDLQRGDFFLVVHATAAEMDIVQVDAVLGLALERLTASRAPDPATATALLTAGLAVRRPLAAAV